MTRPAVQARRDAVHAVVRDRGPVGCNEVARVVGQRYGTTRLDLNALHAAGLVSRIDPPPGQREIGWYAFGTDPDADDLEAILRRAADS